MIVDVARRYDYQPLSTRVRIEPEQQEPKSRIRQWIGMNAEEQVQRRLARPLRWAQGTHFESLGEDISDVSLLQSQRGSLLTSVEDFTAVRTFPTWRKECRLHSPDEPRAV